jgi:hypothetical protein
MKENLNTNAAADSGPAAATPKQLASAAKVQTARENGQKSRGPKTEAGKARSSQNAYKHGFYADRLFATREQWEKDGAKYQSVARGLIEHYQPIGYMENLLVERIAVGFLRSSRIVGHEQKVFVWAVPFETRSANSLPRYQNTIERQLAKDTEHLDRLQAQRKADTASIADDDGDEQVAGFEASRTEQTEAEGALHEEPLASLATLPECADTEPKPPGKSAETNPAIGDGQIAGTNPPKPQSVLADAPDKHAS